MEESLILKIKLQIGTQLRKKIWHSARSPWPNKTTLRDGIFNIWTLQLKILKSVDWIQNKLHNLHSIKRLYRKFFWIGWEIHAFVSLRWRPSRNRLKHSRENISKKNNKEKDTKQQLKCVPFVTEDHKECLDYTMMHKLFY